MVQQSLDPWSIDSLREAEGVVKRSEEGRVILPELKARLPLRDAPYQDHRTAEDPWVGFEKSRTLPIPRDVFEGIRGDSPTATQALFPEIRRACITVDNKLYLWSYLEGQSAFEYHQLREDQVILSVSLVAAKPGVFIDQIKHVLVISTGLSAREGESLTLLGLEFDQKAPRAEVKLYETGMSVKTDGVAMRDVKGTKGGRIFAAGSDQCLYELIYQAQEGWFSNKCHLRNVTSPKLSNLLPTFMKTEKRLDFIALDDARDLLYTLREGSQIDVFRLPSKDSSRAPMRTGGTLGVTRQMGLTHSQSDVGQIVWLGATERDSRTSVVLVAVTEKGHRIFYDDFQGRSWSQLSVRIPPGLPSPQQQQQMLGMQPISQQQQQAQQQAAARSVSTAFISDEVFMIGFNSSMGGGQICCITPGPSSPGGPVSESMTLIALEVGISCPVIAEAKPFGSTSSFSSGVGGGALVRPTANQVLKPPRVFLVLDNNGLTELIERRPMEMLQGLLELGTLTNSSRVFEFFNMYGSVEACSTTLAIASRNSQLTSSSASFSSEEAVSQATRVFFGQLGSWPADSRISHDGLAFYLACLFRPFWDRPLVPTKAGGVKGATSNGSMVGAPYKPLSSSSSSPSPTSAGSNSNVPITREVLEAALRDLTPLSDFMNKHGQLFGLGELERVAQRWDQESFQRLRSLTSRTLEAINFTLFLLDHGLKPLIQSCSDEVKKLLESGLRFGQLVTSQDGKRVARELVNALIEEKIGAQVSIDAIADALQARCGSFCSADDVRQYKATECIRRAKQCSSRGNEREKLDNLKTSLRLLGKGAAQLSPEKLGEVCRAFDELDFSSGVIDLALLCAEEWDPSGLALSFRSDGCPLEEKSGKRYELYEKRRRAYSLVLESLKRLDDELDSAYKVKAETPEEQNKMQRSIDQRDQIRSLAYSRAEACNDALFHEELYLWLMERRLTDQLLEMRTPFLVEFLQGQPKAEKAKDAVHVRCLRDLLWQYYVRVGEYFSAAQVLDALAHSEEFQLELRERIEYLALAVGNAKSLGPGAVTTTTQQAGSEPNQQDVVSFLSQVEEDLEVAQVQAKIRHSLEQIPVEEEEDDQEERERKKLVSESIEWLNEELVDLSSLYKNFAEPFQLLEDQLLIFHTAEYQDVRLVAETWRALISREHESNPAEHAHKAIASLVCQIFQDLSGSSVACPVDVVLDLLERYAFDQEPVGVAMEKRSWPPKSGSTNQTNPIPPGWAPNTLISASCPPETILTVLESQIRNAPPPWNTNSGLGFLLPDLAYFLDTWLQNMNRQNRFPAKRVDDLISETLIRMGTARFNRSGVTNQEVVDLLRACSEMVKRRF
ncbi:hypothetical protein IE53DRAFT_319628 [Violaceomyces palustris]|uniref:Uncharacterized protein n=1 Tax=Violaceomyces palustris TaxID=1673888 RepID=A0ACD0NR54_9BASI|nr:hypothetical protein IE53DRAFT_319628 [Violaceomyces palustris]